MTNPEVVHVAIAPPDIPDADMIQKAAAFINKSLYDTRLLLSGGIPKVIAHYDSRETAESNAQNLRELGLVAIVYKDSELRRPPESFKAHTLEFGEDEVLFRDSDGHVKRIVANDVFLILEGRMQIPVEVATTKSRPKFSLATTLLTSGIISRRKVDEATITRSTQDEYFARLYDRKSSEPSVEILQQQMNYSFLGEKIAASTLANFSTIVVKLREAFPQAVFNDRLMKPFGVNLPSSGVREDAEVNSRLIYSFCSATSGLNSSA